MKILPTYLLITIFLTFFALYIIYPHPEIVYITPNPKNKVSQVFKDTNNVCYRYHREEVKCSAKNK
jgi:hypothetical protein